MLTRKMLKAMGIEEEKIDQIIEAHTETTDALKADRDKYRDELSELKESNKENAQTLKAVQKELEEANKKLSDAEEYKEKYEKEHKAFDDFKAEVATEKVKASKGAAYKALLKKAGVADKYIDDVLKVTVIDDIELDDKGEVKDADKTEETIKDKFSAFIEKKSVAGANTENPPANTGGKMTKEEIMKIKDRNERQKAIEENHELFGF